MQIADLWAKLRLRVDKGSFQGADRALGGIKDRLVGIVAALGAVAGAGAAAKDFLDFDAQLTDLEIASDGAMGSIDGVRSAVLAVSDATGVAKEEVLATAAAYVRLTGDGDTATKSLETFARVAKASGAQAEDVAGTAAAMSQAFGLGAEDFETAFSMMIKAGKAGAVELKDLAGELPRLGGMATQFKGGAGLGGIADLTAALQVVAVGTGGSAKQARTQLQALFTSIISKAKDFKGVKIFDIDPKTGVKSLRNFKDIVTDIGKSDLAKDPTKLTKAFGSVEAYNAFIQLTKAGGEAWNDIAQAQMGATDVADDYAKRSASLSAKVKKAWNTIKNVITKASIIIVEHWEAMAIGLASLGIAIVLFKAKSIAAALASAAAWVISALPLLAIAALIAGLILLVEDLWVMFEGGDSVMGDVFDWLAEQLPRIFDAAITKMKNAFSDFGTWLWKKAKSIPVLGHALQGLEAASDTLDDLRGGGIRSAAAAAERGETPNTIAGAARLAQDAPTRGAGLGKWAVDRARQAITQDNRATISVTVPPGSDAAGIAAEIEKMMRRHADVQARILAGGLP
jgi:TP901 family phage tail tape measure protein